MIYEILKNIKTKSAFFFFFSSFSGRHISIYFQAELLLEKLFQSKAGASRLKYPTSRRKLFISGRYSMGFGGEEHRKSHWGFPLDSCPGRVTADAWGELPAKSLSAPLVVGKQRPQEKKKRYLNSTSLHVNDVQSYWCRKILWPWNFELQNQTIFLKQGRFLAASTNKYVGLWGSLEGLDAGCPGCSQSLLGCGKVAEGCPGCGIKTGGTQGLEQL